jgi:hypothetical protein
MPMIKRGATGEIKQIVNNETETVEDVPTLQWADQVLIKDVLDVPLTKDNNIDVDFDEEDDDDVIAVRM